MKTTLALAFAAAMFAAPSASFAVCGPTHYTGNYAAPVCAPPRPVCQPVCQPRPVCQPVCQPVCDPCRRSGLLGLGILGIL